MKGRVRAPKKFRVPKKLYKEFDVREIRGREVLHASIQGTGYRFRNGTRLTPKNWKNFTSAYLKGRIEICNRGYHAGTLLWFGGSVRNWKRDIRYGKGMLFEVELIGVEEKESGKYVGRQFRIVRKVAERREYQV